MHCISFLFSFLLILSCTCNKKKSIFLNGFNFILNSVFRLIFTFMSFIFISDTIIDFNLVFLFALFLDLANNYNTRGQNKIKMFGVIQLIS